MRENSDPTESRCVPSERQPYVYPLKVKRLHDVGISWKPDGVAEVTTKVLTVIFTADSVARPAALRMKQYNGKNGCTFCCAPGRIVERRRVYLVEPAEMRTDASIRRDALASVEQRKDVNGVKGYSALAAIPEFDLVEGVVVDSCHNPFLGLAKQHFMIIREDVGMPWYIGNPQNLATIDNRMKEIKPPSRISRRPRSITMYKQWKASEWRNWLLYYALPCLDGILQRRYLIHLAQLSRAIFILNNSSILAADLDTAERLITSFVEEFQEYYGEKNMSFNLHLLTHAIQSVRNWGPLWVYSCFSFEALNRKILNSITSPYRRADQIINRFFLSKFIENSVNDVVVAPATQTEIKRLLSKSTTDVPRGIPEGHYFAGVGEPVMRHPDGEEIRMIEATGQPISPNTIISVYKKAVINGVEYQIADAVNRKFCNCIAYCRTGFWFILNIISYTDRDNTIAGIIARQMQDRGSAYETVYMRHFTRSDQTTFSLYNDIIAPGMTIKAPGNVCAVPLCNCWETD